MLPLQVLVPLVAVGAGFHLALTWTLFWSYAEVRERPVLIRAAAWLLLTVQVLALLVGHLAGAAAAAIQHAAFAGAALAFAGAELAPRPGAWPRAAWRRPLAAAGAALTLLAGALPWAPVGPQWPAAAAALAAAPAFALAAHAVRPRPGDQGSGLLTLAYAVGALHALAYPLPPTTRALEAEILAGAVFALIYGAALLRQTRDRVRAAAFFRRVLEALNRAPDTASALDAALGLAMAELAVEQGWVLLRTGGRGDTGGNWLLAGARGFPDWACHGVRAQEYPVERCLCLRDVARPELTHAVHELPCLRLSAYLQTPAGHHATVPLGAGGQVHGLMVLVTPGGRPLPPVAHQLLLALGEQVGLALDRARLYDELRAQEAARAALLQQVLGAQEQERRRIAQELHDQIGQMLTAIVVNADMAARVLAEPVQAAERLARVREVAQSSLQEIHRVIHDLRPTLLDDLGLQAALRWLVRHTLEPAGLQAELHLQGLEVRLPPALETTTFRLVQEAANNAVKHAEAKTVRIDVVRTDGRLSIAVADDGRGLPLGPRSLAPGQGGTGLAGLRERVLLAGGRFEVASAPGQGTRVLAEFPLGGEVNHAHSGGGGG